LCEDGNEPCKTVPNNSVCSNGDDCDCDYDYGGGNNNNNNNNNRKRQKKPVTRDIHIV
jgi:hypothetical protein